MPNPETHCQACGEPLSTYGHCWQHHYPPMDPAQDASTQTTTVTENPLAIVHEVLNDWLEETEATDFDLNDVAILFGLLGVAGYSIVPNDAPSAWAYQQACAALEKHRQRADAAEKLLAQAAEAMAGSYDVTEWPANGSTSLDTALKAIRQHLKAYA